MFGTLYGKQMGTGWLALVSSGFQKADLDALAGNSAASFKADPRVLALAPFSGFRINEVAASALSPNTVPRYGKAGWIQFSGLGSITQIQSGLIAGAVVFVSDPISASAWLSYGLAGSGSDVIGSHAAIGIGSPVPTIVSQTSGYTYYYD